MASPLRQFPFHQIRPKRGEMHSSITWNPYCDLAPTHWFHIGVGAPLFDYGGNAPFPEHEHVDPWFSLRSIIVPAAHSWWDLHGSFVLDRSESYGGASIYVADVHNPIDIERLEFARTHENEFHLVAEVFINFEAEHSGYANSHYSLECDIAYTGLIVVLPTWANPDEVVIPDIWAIPEGWTETTAIEFASRFVDLHAYELPPIIDGEAVTFRPRKR